MVQAVDLFATVAELAGVQAAQHVPPWIALDALSFAPYLANPAQQPLRNIAFSEAFYGPDYRAAAETGFTAVRDDRYKVVQLLSEFAGQDGFPKDEMYDLIEDPFEATDLLLGTLTPAQQARYDFLTAARDALRQPAGLFRTYGGTSCMGSNGPPSIQSPHVPTVGATYDVQLVGGAPSSTAVLFFGLSNESWGGIPLPFPLSAIGGGPGCAIQAAGHLTLALPTDPGGAAALSVPVPLDLGLVNRILFHTWLVIDPAAPGNPLGVTASDGAAAVLGI
jgi:hypothetical protein